MDNTTLKRIFEFLEDKENLNPPFLWKWKNDIPLTEEDLIIKGGLDLRRSNITSLPKGLKVGGGLDLSESDITSLPEGFKVGGYLDLSYSKIISLPKGLKVGGSLDLIESSVEFLPKGLEVERDLYIGDSLLTDYTDEELRDMVKPGFIKGRIYR